MQTTQAGTRLDARYRQLKLGNEVCLDAQLSSNAWQLFRRIDKLKLVDDVIVQSVSRNGKSSK